MHVGSAMQVRPNVACSYQQISIAFNQKIDQLQQTVVQRGSTASIVATQRSDASSFHIQHSSPFIVYHEAFSECLGPNPRLDLLAERDWPAFHEAGVYIKQRNSVLITSNRLCDADDSQRIEVSELLLKKDGSREVKHLSKEQHNIVMGNGGTNYCEGALFCGQGDMSTPSALVHLKCTSDSFQTTILLDNYHSRPFNSINDVVEYKPTGEIFFTDPSYGFAQKFKPPKQLPCQTYAFDPRTGSVRVVCDDQLMPNGIVFSPDWQTCYITDTAIFDGAGGTFPDRPATIYAYDVRHCQNDPALPVYLSGKRVFAFADIGCPDGIKCDTSGNVYSGCGDGVHVWNPCGILVGKILLPQGGCANLVFGPDKNLFILNETRLYEASINASGALAT